MGHDYQIFRKLPQFEKSYELYLPIVSAVPVNNITVDAALLPVKGAVNGLSHSRSV